MKEQAGGRKTKDRRHRTEDRRVMKRWKFWAAMMVMLLAISAARAQTNFTIDWFTIGGGGGTSTGGVYSVSGTIGQPGAGTASGGSYSLLGGFWGVVAAVQTPGAPLLSISYANNQVVVSWPSSTTGWTLQTNQTVTTPNWGIYGGSIVSNTVIISPPKGNLFFRLKGS
jgi:hypothetical protein